MSASDETPCKTPQFSLEESSAFATPATPDNSISNASLADGVETDEESVEGKVISLAAKAAKDDKLTAGWDDHTSDEEEYDPNKENDEEEDDDDESDVELECVDHKRCIEKGNAIFDMLTMQDMKHKGSKKEAKSALVGVICDHFQFI